MASKSRGTLKGTITKDQLDTAALAVQGELARAGFWNQGGRLLRCEVYWCVFPQLVAADAHGFFFHETSWLSRFQGYEVRHIYIPRWVLAEGLWQKRGSLADVVRHEYGHAVAHYYPTLVRRSARFREAFGDRYDFDGPSSSESGCPDRDFCLRLRPNDADGGLCRDLHALSQPWRAAARAVFLPRHPTQMEVHLRPRRGGRCGPPPVVIRLRPGPQTLSTRNINHDEGSGWPQKGTKVAKEKVRLIGLASFPFWAFCVFLWPHFFPHRPRRWKPVLEELRSFMTGAQKAGTP